MLSAEAPIKKGRNVNSASQKIKKPTLSTIQVVCGLRYYVTEALGKPVRIS